MKKRTPSDERPAIIDAAQLNLTAVDVDRVLGKIRRSQDRQNKYRFDPEPAMIAPRRPRTKKRAAFMRLRVEIAGKRYPDGFLAVGSIALHFGADRAELEHALAPLGLFPAQTTYVLTWCDADAADILSVMAYVDDADGNTMVRLSRCDARTVKP